MITILLTLDLPLDEKTPYIHISSVVMVTSPAKMSDPLPAGGGREALPAGEGGQHGLDRAAVRLQDTERPGHELPGGQGGRAQLQDGGHQVEVRRQGRLEGGGHQCVLCN